MTNLSGGWFAGVDCAARITEQNALMTPRVIILSDGHANEGISDGAELCEHAGELRSRGVLTSALGIGDGYDEQLLRGIAENGGGRLHDAELTEEIGSVLLGELDDIFGTVAEEVHLSVTYPAEVRLEPLGNVTAETFGGRTAVYIGSVKNAVERLVVFKVTCPASLHADELQFDANATGRAIDDRSELRAESLTVKLTAAKRTRNTGQPRDEGLAMVVARTWSAHLVAKAAKMNRDGAYQEAQKLITSELKHFRRYVQGLEGGPRMIRELELLSHSVRQAFSPRMSKELVFQSALHMESRSDWRGAEKESWSARMARGD